MRFHAEAWSEALFQAWRQSPNGTNPDGSVNLMSRAAAEDVLALLRLKYPDSEIAAALDEMLLHVADAYAAERIPDRRERDMAIAALQIATLEDGPVIAAATARKVVASFDAGYWFSILRDLIARFLSEDDVLESLEPALHADGEPDRVFSALEALRLYSGAALRSSEDRYAAVAARIGARVRQLAESPSPSIKGSAKAALRRLV